MLLFNTLCFEPGGVKFEYYLTYFGPSLSTNILARAKHVESGILGLCWVLVRIGAQRPRNNAHRVGHEHMIYDRVLYIHEA